MRLIKIRLYPFAGVIDKTFEFQDGLNIVCGPNEAGKSTLMKAIQAVLLIKTNLTPNNFKKTIDSYLTINPNGNISDTICIDLEFESSGEKYYLSKKWNINKPSSSLKKENEAAIQDDTNVQNKLNELINVNESTLKEVLFVDQNKIAGTLKSLAQSPEVTNAVDNLITNALLNTSGIQPGLLTEKLNEKFNELTQNWNLDTNSPTLGDKGKGGYDNRRAMNVGKILSQAYIIKDLESELENANNHERKLNQLVIDIGALRITNNEDITFLNVNKPIVESYSKRQGLLAEKELLENKQKVLLNKKEEWVKVEAENPMLKNEINRVEKEITDIENELAIIVKRNSANNLIDVFTRVNEVKLEHNSCINELEKLTKIDDAEFSVIRSVEQKLVEKKSNLVSALNARKLKIEVITKINDTLRFKQNDSAEESYESTKDTPISFEANGAISIATNSIEIYIKPSEESITQLENEINQLEVTLNDALQKYQVIDINELQNLYNVYKYTIKNKQELESKIKTILNGIEYESLQKEIEEIKNLPSTRDKNIVETILFNQKTILKNKQDTLEKNLQTLKKYGAEFETINALEDEQLTLREFIRNKTKEIDALPELPKGQDFEELKKEFQERQKRYEENKSILIAKEKDKEFAESNPPKFTVEEIEEQIYAKQIFKERAINEAKALKKAISKLEEILNRAATSPYENYHNRLNTYIELLSNEKYSFRDKETLTPNVIENTIENKNILANPKPYIIFT